MRCSPEVARFEKDLNIIFQIAALKQNGNFDNFECKKAQKE